MVRIPHFDPIQYLAKRRFPLAFSGSSFAASGSFSKSSKFYDDQKAKADAYMAELSTKKPDELAALVAVERQKEATQAEQQKLAEEKKRSFNRADAMADFTHWGKLSYWSLDEGVALSLGRSPHTVNWESVSDHRNVSPFAHQYDLRRQTAIRAKEMSQLAERNFPSFFLAWAQRLDWEIPEELVAVVVARSGDLMDWKGAYEKQRAIQEETLKLANENISELKRQLAVANSLPAASDNPGTPSPKAGDPADKPLSARERSSLVKMVIGMAVEKFGYDPKAAKSPTTDRIANALRKQGISLDEDTIRRYLHEGRELLPPD